MYGWNNEKLVKMNLEADKRKKLLAEQYEERKKAGMYRSAESFIGELNALKEVIKQQTEKLAEVPTVNVPVPIPEPAEKVLQKYSRKLIFTSCRLWAEKRRKHYFRLRMIFLHRIARMLVMKARSEEKPRIIPEDPDSFKQSQPSFNPPGFAELAIVEGKKLISKVKRLEQSAVHCEAINSNAQRRFDYYQEYQDKVIRNLKEDFDKDMNRYGNLQVMQSQRISNLSLQMVELKDKFMEKRAKHKEKMKVLKDQENLRKSFQDSIEIKLKLKKKIKKTLMI